MRLKYHPNMTPAELAQLEAELAALDAAYERAAALDTPMPRDADELAEWEAAAEEADFTRRNWSL